MLPSTQRSFYDFGERRRGARRDEDTEEACEKFTVFQSTFVNRHSRVSLRVHKDKKSKRFLALTSLTELPHVAVGQGADAAGNERKSEAEGDNACGNRRIGSPLARHEARNALTVEKDRDSCDERGQRVEIPNNYYKNNDVWRRIDFPESAGIELVRDAIYRFIENRIDAGFLCSFITPIEDDDDDDDSDDDKNSCGAATTNDAHHDDTHRQQNLLFEESEEEEEGTGTGYGASLWEALHDGDVPAIETATGTECEEDGVGVEANGTAIGAFLGLDTAVCTTHGEAEIDMPFDLPLLEGPAAEEFQRERCDSDEDSDQDSCAYRINNLFATTDDDHTRDEEQNSEFPVLPHTKRSEARMDSIEAHDGVSLSPRCDVKEEQEELDVPVLEGGETKNATDGTKLKGDTSIHEIAPHFKYPIDIASEILNVSVTLLKRICRQNNVPRWPYRKLKHLLKNLDKVTCELEEHADTYGSDSYVLLMSEKMALEDQIDDIMNVHAA